MIIKIQYNYAYKKQMAETFLAIGMVAFLGIDSSFLVRKSICCHLLDFCIAQPKGRSENETF